MVENTIKNTVKNTVKIWSLIFHDYLLQCNSIDKSTST